MKNIDIKKFYGPEYYMEEQGQDTRIAMARINDFIQTMGDASFSLTYSNREEHKNTEEFELSIIRRFHLRHALIDLNNSFDLLLQIPWIFFRYWKLYNKNGMLYHPNKKSDDIERNVDGWVEEATIQCNSNKVIKATLNSSEEEIVNWGKKLKSFQENYIFNDEKKFTVRTLSNSMKHKSAIRFKEFNEPYAFNLNIDKKTINPSEENLKIVIETGFWDIEKQGSEENPDGMFHLNYTDDLYLDIEYFNGEMFRASDYLDKRSTFSLDEVFNECLNFNDEIVDLFNEFYEIIDSKISLSPLFKIPEEKVSDKVINFDKYFKAFEQDK